MGMVFSGFVMFTLRGGCEEVVWLAWPAVVWFLCCAVVWFSERVVALVTIAKST